MLQECDASIKKGAWKKLQYVNLLLTYGMYLVVVKFTISISGAQGSQADIELTIAAVALFILFVKTEKYKEFLEDEEEER